MTLLSTALLSPSSWTVTGAPLANHLWQSTVFAGAVWLLTLLLRKNHAHSRYVLWLTASLKFLIPFSLLIGLGSHLSWSRTPADTQPAVFLAMETLSEPFGPVNPIYAALLPSPSALQVAGRVLPALLLAMWLVGSLVVLSVWYLRWRRLNSARRTALALQSGRELEALRRMERTARFSEPIDLLLSKSALEPGILGIFRPALLLPAGISERLTDAQLESIIAHELSHVCRRDNLAATLHMLVESVFWFHPLVWWMGAHLLYERERACDEEVLRLGADPHVYAESILKVCKFYLKPPLFCAAGVSGSNLKKRIEAIMTKRIARNLEPGKKLLLGTMGAAAVVVPIIFGLLHASQSIARSQAQNAPIPPTFETVSIKPNNGTPMAGFSIVGKPFGGIRWKADRFMATNFTLHKLIQRAYDVQDDQILGGPDWVNSEGYDIDAKVEKSVVDKLQRLGPDQRVLQSRRMLQEFLADRFKLSFHSETKEVPVFALVIAENGLKIQRAILGDTYANGFKRTDGVPLGTGDWSQPGKFVGQGVPIAPLVQDLSEHYLHRTILDKTGLTDKYDFTLQWTPVESEAAIFTAIQEQLGLKLEPQKGATQILVIDHAEKITGDESSQTQQPAQSVEKSQAANTPASSKVSRTCLFAGAKYPEGRIIQEGNGPEQQCARVLDRGNVNENGQPRYTVEWIHTSQTIRERSKNIIHLPVSPIAFCTPKPSTESNLCSCEESGFFSEHSLVDSANGKLSCKKSKWVPLGVDHSKQANTEEQAGAPRSN